MRHSPYGPSVVAENIFFIHHLSALWKQWKHNFRAEISRCRRGESVKKLPTSRLGFWGICAWRGLAPIARTLPSEQRLDEVLAGVGRSRLPRLFAGLV